MVNGDEPLRPMILVESVAAHHKSGRQVAEAGKNRSTPPRLFREFGGRVDSDQLEVLLAVGQLVNVVQQKYLGRLSRHGTASSISCLHCTALRELGERRLQK